MDESFILHKGHVTHVIDPSSFWMRMGTDADFHDFEEYQKTLDQYYNRTGRRDSVSADSLSLGDSVMVASTGQGDTTVTCDKNSGELHWSRANVSRVADDKVDVFYIDLGNTEIVDISNLKNIDQQLFDYIPPQVIQLGIAGIKPLSRSWTSRAIAIFESKVLKQEVVASLIEYDDTNKYGQVIIYVRHDDCTWRSLTSEMLDEELGLPVEPRCPEFLSQDTVLAALKLAEQENETSMHSLENNSDGDDDDDGGGSEDKKTVGSQQQVSTSKSVQSVSPSWKSCSHHGNLMLQHEPGSASKQDCENSTVGVPAFDLHSLKSTRFISLSKMQEDKNAEQRQQIRARLQQEMPDSEEEDVEENLPEMDWGKTDLKIGEAVEFPDFDNCIREEIYKHSPRQSSQEDLAEFFHEPTRVHGDKSSSESFNFQEIIQANYSGREKVTPKPLSEIEDYNIQKKIEEILLNKDGGELELVCVLINSVIEPDFDVTCDRLVAVFTAILETLVRHCTVDSLIAIAALETYLETRAFNEAIGIALKSLVTMFIKTTKSSSHYRALSEVLALLFVRADQWPASACAVIHTLVMRSLEHWTIFNTQRVQVSASSVKLEHLYLECVEIITDIAWEAMSSHLPESCLSLIEDIKHKLLHDDTDRNARIQLLNILLKCQEKTFFITRAKPPSRDTAIQTEDRHGSSSIIIASQDTDESQDYSGRSTDIGKTFDKSATGKLYSTSTQYIPDIDKNLDTHLEGPLLNHHNQDIHSSALTAPPTQRDIDAYDNPQISDHFMQISQTGNRHHEHQNVRFLPDISFSDKHITRETSDFEIKSLHQSESCMLNGNAPTFAVRSTYCLTQQLDNNKLYQSDAQKHRLVPDISPKSTASSQDIYKDALNPEQFSMGSALDRETAHLRNGTDIGGSSSLEMCMNRSGEHEVSGNSDEMYVSVCSSPTDLEEKSSSEQNCEQRTKTTESGSKLSIIKYTSMELRALNTQSSAPVVALETVNEACEIGFAIENVEISTSSDEHQSVKPHKFLSSAPLHRYSGSGDSPIEISEGPKSNTANWKLLSELLNESCFRHGHINFGTSVDPEYSNLEVNNHDPSVKTKSSSLVDIAKGLISPPSSENNLSSGECKALSNDGSNECAGGASTNSCDSPNSVVASDGKSVKPQWPETFIKSIEETHSTDAIHFVHSHTSNGQKGKKKKTKFRPISEVLVEKPPSPIDSDQPQVYLLEGDLCEDLQIEIDEAGGQIISQPRLGALSGRSSNRSSSLLSDLRQERPKASPWVPGIRRCTWCGSKDHTVYDCTREDPLRNVKDQSYTF